MTAEGGAHLAIAWICTGKYLRFFITDRAPIATLEPTASGAELPISRDSFQDERPRMGLLLAAIVFGDQSRDQPPHVVVEASLGDPWLEESQKGNVEENRLCRIGRGVQGSLWSV